MNQSSVETPAPEWLSKLESRREKLTKRKLGHESGAGAPCSLCGIKCPGLDLHFWRKVCRNCKCRKDQHECNDDDINGWAQFEILGQIRSKPAYIKISTHEDQLVDWIPPNVAPDIVADYMNQLGADFIPISGSDAAAKRKQQLEFQVPPHDLDPSLCDNLTTIESEQLKQYVNKIKENSVGQGNIVRIDVPITYVKESENIQDIPRTYTNINTAEYSIIPTIYHDKIMCHILNSDIVSGILQNPATIIQGSKIQTFNRPLKSDFDQNPNLSDKNKYKLKLMKLNSQAIQSYLIHSVGYDNLMNALKDKKINYNSDTLIKPIDDLRCEYLKNDKFRNDVNNFVNSIGKHFLDTIPEISETVLEFPKSTDIATNTNDSIFKTPLKMKKQPQFDEWNSPLPVKNIQSKQGNLMQQETPIRKINLGIKNNIQDIFNSSGKPIVSTIEQESNITPVGSPLKTHINPSKSNDSGFESSLPPTPNFSTYPGIQSFSVDQSQDVNISAESGKLISIPGITDLNMYPQIKSGIIQNPHSIESLNQGVGNMQITSDNEIHKKHSILNCKQCKKGIQMGEIAVKADRAGKNVGWHPQCFVCHKCNELLADLVYFYHGENIYCARDLAMILKIPRCNACDELIFTKEYTAAEGATFHIKHFCCYQCDLPLAGQQYLPDEKTNMPLCLNCYHEYYAEKCEICTQIIGPENVGVSWGSIHWHADCFNCAGSSCSKSLIGGRFYVKENMPFCSSTCVKSVIH